MTRDGMCGVFIPDRVLAGWWGSQWKVSDHWLPHQPARTVSGINTPHIPSLVILHPPAYEDGTDRGFQNVGLLAL